MAKKPGVEANRRLGDKVLRAIRLAKARATGRLFRALHVAEGMVVGAVNPNTYRKRGKRKPKKKT